MAVIFFTSSAILTRIKSEKKGGRQEGREGRKTEGREEGKRRENEEEELDPKYHRLSFTHQRWTSKTWVEVWTLGKIHRVMWCMGKERQSQSSASFFR